MENKRRGGRYDRRWEMRAKGNLKRRVGEPRKSWVRRKDTGHDDMVRRVKDKEIGYG